eukprot:4040865-Alexandrium_andersonii.AAC.1
MQPATQPNPAACLPRPERAQWCLHRAAVRICQGSPCNAKPWLSISCKRLPWPALQPTSPTGPPPEPQGARPPKGWGMQDLAARRTPSCPASLSRKRQRSNRTGTSRSHLWPAAGRSRHWQAQSDFARTARNASPGHPGSSTG